MKSHSIERDGYYSVIPCRILKAINGHVRKGISTGGFVHAVMSNDLKEAVGRADDECRKVICEIVGYLYNVCPTGCWGSKEKVMKWRRGGGAEGFTASSGMNFDLSELVDPYDLEEES